MTDLAAWVILVGAGVAGAIGLIFALFPREEAATVAMASMFIGIIFTGVLCILDWALQTVSRGAVL